MAVHEGETGNNPIFGRVAPLALLPAMATLFPRENVILILGSSIADKLFTSYSHTHFPLSASGLRVETSRTTDKKISEVYFVVSPRKILTENLNRQVTD